MAGKSSVKSTSKAAPRTTVAGNTFRDVVYGVRVEDDDARVVGNRFVANDAGTYAVVAGTPYRTNVLGRPVTGTVLTGNRAVITGNASPYRWVDGELAEDVVDVAGGVTGAVGLRFDGAFAVVARFGGRAARQFGLGARVCLRPSPATAN